MTDEPKSPLSRFLAAPDTVLKNEAERKKLLARKAGIAAEEAQLRAHKSTERPTDEDLLGDMRRVAGDANVNPHWKFKTLSRKRYRLFGHWPIEWIDERFGQFEHAKQVAGLEDEPGTKAKKGARAAESRREHTRRYLERVIQPYVRKNVELERELTGTKLMLSISDTHATFLDPFTWLAFLSACKELKPDIVYANGDIMEGAEISRYDKIPGWTVDLQTELDFAREMFRQIRAVVPKETRVVWGAGNHGLDRMASYLTQVAPAFAKLRSMRFDELVDLEGLDVELAMGGTIASPVAQEDDKPGRLLYGFYRIHHGTKLGGSPAAAELDSAGRSGQSGHVHRASLSFGTNEANRTMSWMTTPMGCTERAGRAYMRGICTGWQKGFGVCFLSEGGHVRQYPVITDDGYCTVEGYEFRAPQDLLVPDVKKMWLPELEAWLP